MRKEKQRKRATIKQKTETNEKEDKKQLTKRKTRKMSSTI